MSGGGVDRDPSSPGGMVATPGMGIAVTAVSNDLQNTQGAKLLVEKILANMSQRGAEMLREDMAASAPQRKAVVEEAQGKIVAAVRRLEDAGALVIRRGAEEEEEVV